MNRSPFPAHVEVTPLGALAASLLLFLLGWLGNLLLNRSRETRDHTNRLVAHLDEVRERAIRIETELEFWRPVLTDFKETFKRGQEDSPHGGSP